MIVNETVPKAQVTSRIKREIEKVFGRKILSNRDCIQLSEAIYARTNFTVNANTLRRFFGLIRTKYAPSLATLSILAKYCGFHSLEDLLNFSDVNQPEGTIQKESILLYFFSLFKDIHTAEANDESFYTLVRHTIIFLSHNPQITDEFQRLVAKTKNGRKYYFERFVHIDALNSFYGNGLRYYLNERKKDEGQIFAHSLLVFRYWLTMEAEKLEKHFQQTLAHPVDSSFHPHASARYFAGRLYQAEAGQASAEQVLAEAWEFYSASTSSKSHNYSIPFFEIVFSEALILTGYFEEGLCYIQYACEKYADLFRNADTGPVQNCLLFKAIALLRTGENRKASDVFGKIKPSEFFFLSKKYCNILYLQLSNELRKKKLKDNDQLDTLLMETGFVRLENILEPASRHLMMERAEAAK